MTPYLQPPMRALGEGAAMTLRGSNVGFGFNLGLHVGDDSSDVLERRLALARELRKPIFWVDQTHSTRVLEIKEGDSAQTGPTPLGLVPKDPNADALVTSRNDCVLAIMTADCLPVIFRTQNNGCVGVAHAGWRGLLNGVLDNTVLAMRQLQPHAKIQTQFGVAIGPSAWEVGLDVVEAFVARNASTERCFSPAGSAGKYWGDLYELASIRLAGLDVVLPNAPRLCTFKDPANFFSYRRDGRSAGRQATLVWRSG